MEEKKNEMDTKEELTEVKEKSPNEEVVTKREYEELKEKMLRIAAEFENYKRRTQTEISKSKAQAKVELIRQILPIMDEFELAVIALQANTHNDTQSVFRGIEMVYANMKEALSRAGLSEIKTDGVFDPMSHEVVMVKEHEADSGTIVDVIKKGYIFEGMMVRPASVIISSGKSE